MKPYYKIPTIFARDPETKFKTLIEGLYATDELGYLAQNDWEFTEKVDGTNIRVIYDAGAQTVEFRGRTDKAQIPPFLVDKLEELFPLEKMLNYSANSMTLYGEGYGRKIQNGGNYIRDGVNFILFDVAVDDWWLKEEQVLKIARDLDIERVPVVGYGTLSDAVKIAREGLESFIAEVPGTMAEGLVCKPFVQLFDRRGQRIIAKIKHKDFERD